jgi:outer membrane protein OmpA-like peptidoglycan-associated protein
MMLLQRLIDVVIAGTCIAISIHADAAAVHYFDERATLDAHEVAQILNPLRAEAERASRPSWSSPRKNAPIPRARKIDTLQIDPTLARERRINALAQAAVADWKAQRTRAKRGKPTAVRTDARILSSSPASVAIGIHFADGSAQLPPSANTALDALAQGIRLSGIARALLIEGHTAPSGNAARDMQLSRLRAQSVKRYLVRRHAVSPELLRTAGVGAQRLLNRKNPRASENQRVQLSVLI